MAVMLILASGCVSESPEGSGSDEPVLSENCGIKFECTEGQMCTDGRILTEEDFFSGSLCCRIECLNIPKCMDGICSAGENQNEMTVAPCFVNGLITTCDVNPCPQDC